MNKEHSLVRTIREHQRRAANGFTCPVCEHTYYEDGRIWNHGLKNHRQYLGDLDGVGKAGRVRKRYQEEALARAQLKADVLRKAGNPAAELTKSPLKPQSPPSNKADEQDVSVKELEPHDKDKGRSQGPEKNIDDFRDLSLEQGDPDDGRNAVTTLNNPRKRGPEGHSGSTGPPAETSDGRLMGAKVRHGKTLSGDRYVEADYKRGITGRQRKPLFDPSNDRTNNSKEIEWEAPHGLVPAGGKIPPRDSRTSPLKKREARRETSRSSNQYGNGKPQVHQLVDQAVLRTKQQPPSTKEREDESSESPVEDDPRGGDYRDSQDVQPEMLLQPETRPISHVQLVVEVKGIYAGLVMVEAKCIDIDERQSAAAQEKDLSKRPELKDDQWQSLIALHKQLLHEHHDFFLASQHPSASDALSRLAAKYSMPARMWRHGIHAFLEVLRHRLPESLEHMLAFVYIAYSMMALLYETVPAFEDTWIECLGDLGRYRMAIEDDEPKDREVWSNVAKFWYNKASDKTPDVGRLYHHLAILARPYTLEQLSLYARSLLAVNPFESAKGSIMTLFGPILNNKDITQRRSYSLETLLIMIHALFFISKPSDSPDQIDLAIEELQAKAVLEKYISRMGFRFKEIGVSIAIAMITALFEYGSSKDGRSKSRLRITYEYVQSAREKITKSLLAEPNDSTKSIPFVGSHASDVGDSMTIDPDSIEVFVHRPTKLASLILATCLRYPNDGNVYPLIHVYLVFFWSLVIVLQNRKEFDKDVVLKTIEKQMPWDSLCAFLNTLAEDSDAMTENVWNDDFPRSLRETDRPLPEDYVMRGQVYTQWYFPNRDKDKDSWFATAMVDEDERAHDLPSMAQPRKERMLWLGLRISTIERWIYFDKENRSFITTDYANKYLLGDGDLKDSLQEADMIVS